MYHKRWHLERMHTKMFLSFFNDLLYETKVGMEEKMFYGHAEICLLIHIHQDRDNAAEVSKTFLELQLSHLVVRANGNKHKIFYAEHGKPCLEFWSQLPTSPY